MKSFVEKNNNVFVVTSLERKFKRDTCFMIEQGVKVLRVKTGNLQKNNIIEKAISTLLIERQYRKAIKKYFNNIKFDLVISSTPPITFTKLINYIKKRDKAKSYLLLKDIFPQNAVDMGMIKYKGIIYRYFRRKEIKLYNSSDYVGCMSKGNKKYILKHNPYLKEEKVEVCPNSINPRKIIPLSLEEKEVLRKNLGVKKDALLILYGGNLGRPQGIPFLMEIIKDNKNKKEVFFLIVGYGTEFNKLKIFLENEKANNVKLMKSLNNNKYDNILKISDIGLILLDKRFTIPNFPSRLLSYMEFSLPVIAATDINTDIKDCINEGSFGYWCESGNLKEFNSYINKFTNDKELSEKLGSNANKYLYENYNLEKVSNLVIDKIKK
ncbi:glycosyltransferase [Clostridium tarantellae]|uniref:Glycosyltransferase n=2 Tax=Clostridium tarantellae TaxID=39493 RepID=A0A6I1MQX4_9CLOT|nr:glycosyltransferase [Clostridium tarantellae]